MLNDVKHIFFEQDTNFLDIDEYKNLNAELCKRVCKLQPNFYMFNDVVKGIVTKLVNEISEEKIKY